MSILGYSSAYFLPQYWASTPLYGEKLIPLLDYILSVDYEHTDKLATAFYNIESKYKNTQDLPIGQIEAIIEESGYGYIRDLLGQDEESVRLLVYLLVLIHQLKGSKKGVEVVLEMLRAPDDAMVISFVGDITPSAYNEVSGFTTSDYIAYSNFSTSSNFSINFQIRTGSNFATEQCIASSPNYGLYLGIDTSGRMVLSVGEQILGQRAWQEVNGETAFVSARALRPDTNYYITLTFNGSEYDVLVSTDGDKYLYYITVDSSKEMGIKGGTIYLGIDRSTSEPQQPFGGEISLAPFTVSSNNVKLTQWFETLPVGEEDTFAIDAELDIGLISPTFFVQFVKFVERYVYPTLKAFRAKLMLKSKVTFLPYVRQKVTYIASNVEANFENFNVKEEENTQNYEPFEVVDDIGEHEDFMVPKSNN